MTEWIECTLSDLVSFQRGYDLPKSHMQKGQYPVVGSNGIIGFHNEYTTDEPSITIGRSGNVGKPFIYYGKTWSHNTTLYVKDYKGNDPVFVFYFLKTMDLANYGGGSAVPTLNRNHIHTLSICVPKNIEQQKKIGVILATIDHKILINNAINDNLEQQAQAIFKAWFVDFEPFGGVMPDDWKVYKLGEFLPVITGKKNANISSAKGLYPFFSCSHDINWTDEYSFDGYAILVAGNGDFNVKWYNGKFEAYQRTYVLIPHNPRYTSWLYYAVKHNLSDITRVSRGSVISFITKSNLEDFSFVAPKNLEKFNLIDKFISINEIIDNNIKEIYRLTSLRDTLLPKLMSGEIDVSNIEI